MERPSFSKSIFEFNYWFWGKVIIKGENECWSWTGASSAGYGHVRRKGILYTAHSIAYELAYKISTKGLDVMHVCHNRLCCNPQHLELGSRSENMLHTSYSPGGTIRSNNSSGITGVSRHGSGQYWEARVIIDREQITLYRGYDFFEACCAKKSWEAKQMQEKGFKWGAGKWERQ